MPARRKIPQATWAQRDPATWYHSNFWRKRAHYQVTKVQGLCEICLEKGVVRLAQIADHHPPWRTFEEFCTGPLRSVCFDHHQVEARFEQRRGFERDVGLDGFPVDPNHPVHTGVIHNVRK